MSKEDKKEMTNEIKELHIKINNDKLLHEDIRWVLHVLVVNIVRLSEILSETQQEIKDIKESLNDPDAHTRR